MWLASKKPMALKSTKQITTVANKPALDHRPRRTAGSKYDTRGHKKSRRDTVMKSFFSFSLS